MIAAVAIPTVESTKPMTAPPIVALLTSEAPGVNTFHCVAGLPGSSLMPSFCLPSAAEGKPQTDPNEERHGRGDDCDRQVSSRWVNSYMRARMGLMPSF
jgi:hypothetical protein